MLQLVAIAKYLLTMQRQVDGGGNTAQFIALFQPIDNRILQSRRKTE
jgi:hypothetical protein